MSGCGSGLCLVVVVGCVWLWEWAVSGYGSWLDSTTTTE